MKILKSWLRDFVEINQSDRELDDLLTFSGTLVEGVSGGIDPKIIVVKILEINPHPNADRLRLAKLSNGQDEIQVVCGAPNIEVGQIVPLAQVGSRVLDFEVKEAEIRGISSPGMLLSPRELGISKDHRGVHILDNKCELGKPVSNFLINDSVFELEITPNRGDCLSHLGIAREVAALTDRKLKFDEKEIESFEKLSEGLKIEIQNPDHCFKYCATIIKGVKIAPSPKWLQDKLVAIGHNPINNVVDITNFIMEDLGQPLHAFDKNKILGDTIIARSAKEGEKIITIDGVKRTLDQEMLVIADREKAVAIAGVMGGAESAIDDQTTDIILESAVFERKIVRRTAKVLRLTTDASYRFERGIDAELTKTAMLKAAKMIVEICGGEIAGTFADTAVEIKNDYIKIEHGKINELLGTKFENSQIDGYLQKLGFKIKDGMALPPSWRHDAAIWEDLAEEVSRLYGFKNIPMVEMPKAAAPKTADYYFRENIKDILVEENFTEVFTYPFLSDGDIETIGLDPDNLLEVANPVQSENKYMRNSLIPGLMRALAKNPTFDPILIFEAGNTFNLEDEKTQIAIAASGKGAKSALDKCVSALAEKTGVQKSEFEIKEFARDDLLKYKIKKIAVYVLELDTRAMIKAMRNREGKADFVLAQKPIRYRELSKLPPVNRDLSFIVANSTSTAEIKDLILEISDKVFLIELFDEFASDRFGENKKSVAFHIWLQDLEKTLSDKEADEEISKIIAELSKKFEAKLRG